MNSITNYSIAPDGDIIKHTQFHVLSHQHLKENKKLNKVGKGS